MFERATRECRMSPTIVTVSPSMRPFSSRTVKQVEQRLRRVLVRAVAGVDDGRVEHVGDALRHARDLVAHDDRVGVHRVERLARCRGCSRAFVMLEFDGEKFTTSAESRLPAISKLVRVRVDDSKNRLMIVRPRSVGTFLTSRSPTSCMCFGGLEDALDLAALEVLDPEQVAPHHRSLPLGSLEHQRDLERPVELAAPSRPRTHDLSRARARRDVLADVVDLDRQLAVAAVDERHHLDGARPPEVHQRVHRRADRAAGAAPRRRRAPRCGRRPPTASRCGAAAGARRCAVRSSR